MAPARWDRISRTVESAHTAYDTGDLDAFQLAVKVLKLAGPTKVTPISPESDTPPPPQVEERLAYLISRLSSTPDADQESR